MAFNNTTNTTNTGAYGEPAYGTAGHQNAGLTGSNHGTTHSKVEDGGVADALNPAKGGGAHLPHSGSNEHGSATHGTNQYDNNAYGSSNTHSNNPLSSNTTHSSTHPTGTHASSGLTGSTASHGHGYKPEDGGVVDALNPSKGVQGSHLPNSNQSHAGTHSGVTGQGHSSTGHSNNPLSSTGHSNNPLSSNTHSSTTGVGHDSHAPLTGRAGSPTLASKNPIGNHDGTNGQHGTHNVVGGHSSTQHGAHTSTADHTKPSLADKAKGTVESLVGKVTKNPAKVAEGEALKTGDHVHGAAAGANTAAHSSTH